MAAQTGRSNNKFIGFFLDNSSGTLTDLTAYTKDVGDVGPDYDKMDVTAFSDGSKNYTIGIPAMPLTITFVWDTVVLTHLAALNPQTPLSLDIRFGVRQTYTAGEPQFGITMSSTSGYVITGFKCKGTESITANFDVFGATAPAFGTAAET